MKEITKELVMNSIPERKTESHKGDFGKVLIIAGSKTMTGALLVSIRAMAVRCFWPPERVTPRSPTTVS